MHALQTGLAGYFDYPQRFRPPILAYASSILGKTITFVLPPACKVLDCLRKRYYIVRAMPHKYLLKEFEEFARSAAEPSAMMQRVSQRIHMHIPRYNWVGFYLVDPKDPSILVLGPHTGSFTPKPKISWSEGLCGSAAASRRIVVSDNVAEDPRYIQASDLVKSQISAPVLVGAKVMGVFNVESYFMATFKHALERDFVEGCARIVAKCFARTLSPDFVNV